MTPAVHFHAADWMVAGLYIAALVTLAVRGIRGARPRSASAVDYILNGRTLTLPSFVAALVSTWYGGILGVGEFSYLHGLSNWFVFGVPYYAFAFVFAVFFARRIRESSRFSIPDMFTATYGGRTGLLASGIVFFISTPAPYIFMQAVLLQAVTGASLTVCIAAGTALSVGYMLAGGFRSLVRVDLLQFALMFGGFFLLAGVLIVQHGVFPFLSNALPPSHLTLTGDNTWQYIIVWYLIALWTLVAPQFHQFTLSARTPGVARRGILVSIICWTVFDGITTLTGLYARALLPPLGQASMSYPLLGELALPPALKGLFFISMYATVMSSTDGLTFISAVTVGRDMLAKLFGRDDDRSVTAFTRIGVVVTALVAVGAVLLFPSVIELWYVVGTLFIPSLLLPLISAYYPAIRLTPARTFTTMMAGFLCAFPWYIAGIMRAGNAGPRYLFGIEPMFAGLAVTVLCYLFLGPAQRRNREQDTVVETVE